MDNAHNDKKYFENKEEKKDYEGLEKFKEEKQKEDEEKVYGIDPKKYNEIKNKNRKEKMKEFNEWAFCIIIAVILAFLIKFFIGTFTTVKQTSMYPTFKDGDRLWLNRVTRTFNTEYKRGDIITFESPLNENVNISNKHPKAMFKQLNNPLDKFSYYFIESKKISLIKRIIAMPGENVKIENGEIYINGEKLDEPYLHDDVKTDSLNLTEFIVPEGSYFVLGDNRSASSDSRIFGCIPKEKIEGRIGFYVWPISRFGLIDVNEKREKN